MIVVLLKILFIVAIVWLLLSAYSISTRKAYKRQLLADEIHFCDTKDGWRIGIYRFKSKKEGKSEPVLLVHGLTSNPYIFDAFPDLSLARFLACGPSYP